MDLCISFERFIRRKECDCGLRRLQTKEFRGHNGHNGIDITLEVFQISHLNCRVADREIVGAGRLAYRAFTDKEVEEDGPKHRTLGHTHLHIMPRRRHTLPNRLALKTVEIS